MTRNDASLTLDRMIATGCRIALGLTALTVGLACAQDEGLDAEDTLSRRLAEAMCGTEHENDCGCEPTFSSPEVCEERWFGIIRDVQLVALDAGAQVALDCVDEHISAIEALDCTSLGDYARSGANPTCQMYFGDRALGERCTGAAWATFSSADFYYGAWMSDCEQGLVCAADRCVSPEMPWTLLEPDAPCFDTAENRLLGLCPQGQACNDVSGLCVPLAQQGESCAGGIPCADSWCDGNTCAARKADGEPCGTSLECTGGSCPDGVCTTATPLAAACFPYAF